MLVIDAIQNTLDITQSERGEVLQYLTALCNGCFHKYYCWLGIRRAGIRLFLQCKFTLQE